MRKTVVLLASAALTVLLLGVAALLLWTQQAQAQEIRCNTELCIDKTADKSTVEVGQPITFTITQRCPNARACYDPNPLVDTLPSGLTVDSVSRPGFCPTSGNTVTCQGGRFIESVAPFQLIIVATTTECGTFTNTASAGENSGSVTHTVEGCPPPLPTMKEQSKKGGWKEFGYPDQGKCVSDVNRRNRQETEVDPQGAVFAIGLTNALGCPTERFVSPIPISGLGAPWRTGWQCVKSPL